MLRDVGFFEKRGFVVEIEATPRCNLACPFCDHRPGGEASGPDRPEVDLDAVVPFLAGTFAGRKFSVLVNGGEPTLRPELPDFVEKVMKIPGASIEIYTNLTAPDEYYARLLCAGADVVPTFHEEAFSSEGFAGKMARCGIRRALIPCTPVNMVRAAELLQKIPDAEFEPLEDRAPSLLKSAAITKLDPRFAGKIRTLLKTRTVSERICRSGERYLYVDGDCSVRRCMFTDEPPVWDVMKGPMDLGVLLEPVLCREWCTYEFRR